MSFWFEEHTADVTLVASGSSFSDALASAARGVTGVMTEQQVSEELSFPVELVAESREALLFDFVAHIIFLLDAESLFVARADLVVSCEGGVWSCSGTVFGDLASGYERSGDVKAPTYNRLSVWDEDGLVFVRLTLDL